jgi:PKD repeat protein
LPGGLFRLRITLAKGFFMSRFNRLILVFTTALLPIACSITPPEQPTGARPEIIFEDIGGVWQPARGIERSARPAIPDGQFYRASGPFQVSMRDVPAADRATPDLDGFEQRGGGRIESQLPDEAMDRLREEARFLQANPLIRDIGADASLAPAAAPAAAGSGFPSVDYNECCGLGGNVPPDPELAAGPNHVIAVVNVAFEIFDTGGNSVVGPTTFASFFNGVSGCTGVFDPNANYDEEADRFIIGIDGNGTDYCIAVSQTSNPTGDWWLYSFQTSSGRNFFDYPHAGVGDEAIFLGANIFGVRRFKEGRIWAIDKNEMYAGTAPTVVTFGTGSDGTPQPMNLHGWNQGTWPNDGVHYIMTDGASFNGSGYGVWSWTNPFGGNDPVKQGEVNLNTATGIIAGSPVDSPQSGGGSLQANDWRVQDAEYRDGDIWMSNAQSCNPGGGTVNCVRWAQIDPSGPSVVNADVYASPGEYRTFPDLAVDACGNMMMGYSKTSSTTNPGIFAIGREAGSAVGSEITVKTAEIVYDAFDGSPHRWGDYTEMTISPDGSTFWYLGEYSKNTGNANGRWGTWVNSFTFGCDGGGNPPPTAVIDVPSCTDLDCDFNGGNSMDDTGISAYDWKFGDGNTGSGVAPNHVYAAEGAYNVSLKVTDDDGATDTANYSLEVDDGINNPPNAVITSIICDNATRSCSYNGTGSSDSDGEISTYDWDFGDTSSGSSGATTNHSYAAYGSYTVRLTVTDDGTDTDFAEELITLTEPVDPVTISVASIVVDTQNSSGGNKSPRATVTIHDEQDNPVDSVSVDGLFTGDAPGSDSGTTGANGTVVLTSGAIKRGKVKFTFCVTNVIGDSLTWDDVEAPCASN